MVLVSCLANFAKEVHVIDATKFVLVEEAYEAFELRRSQILRYFSKSVEKALRGDETYVGLVVILKELDDLFFSVWVDLFVDFFEHCVAVVYSLVGLSREVSNQITHRNHVAVVLQL